jgi:hypothetical protein
VEPITPSDVTGFDSTTPNAGETLTITYDGQTTTYDVAIQAAPALYAAVEFMDVSCQRKLPAILNQAIIIVMSVKIETVSVIVTQNIGTWKKLTT